MKTFFFLFILVAVAVSSACIQKSNAGGEAIRFNRLGFAPAIVQDNEITAFELDIQNTGGQEITFAKAYFYGIPKISLPHIAVATKAAPLKAPSSTGSSGDRYAFSEEFDLYNSTTGESVFDLPQGTTQTYVLTTRLVHNYTTEATSTFDALTREAYLQEKQRGKEPKARQITTQSLKGPIQVRIKTEQPVVFFKEGDKQKARILFLVENIGGGIPLPSFDESANTLNLDIQNTNKIGPLSLKLDNEPVDCGGNRGHISLFNNRAEIYCDISIQRPILEQQHHLTVTTDYYYVVDKETALIVQGTRVE